MSKTKHKIKIKDSKGFTYTVPLFTELKDLKNNKGKPIKVLENKKIITLYYPIGEVDDPERTPGRIKDSKGNVFALLNTGTPPYTEKLFTVPQKIAKEEDYKKTVTVPAGVSRIRIAMCDPGVVLKKEFVKYNDEGNEVYKYYLESPSETKIVSKDKKINISPRNMEKRKNVRFGCKASFTFERRETDEDRSKYYGCAYRDTWSYGTPECWYYSGYVDVTPGQVFNIQVGGKCNKDNDEASHYCGFILVAYGVGIEK